MSEDQVKQVSFDAVTDADKQIEIVSYVDKNNDPYKYDISYVDVNGQKQTQTINFQHGPVKEYGINGVTMEYLLVIIADRLKAFQNSKFACGENEQALMNVNDALDILNHRTRKRIERGVEGKNVV